MLAGVDASISYENNHTVIDLQTKDALFEYNELMREPVTVGILQGALTLDHNDDGWQINTDQLQVRNDHVNSFSRIALQLSADKTVFVDAQTDFYDGYGKYVKHYLPVGIMTPALVEWLDMAVTDGHIPAGKFVLYGDLDKFPYQDHTGVFQAMFTVHDVNMKFVETWPMLKKASANIKFDAQSLFISAAHGKTMKVKMFNGSAQILDLAKPHLTVKTRRTAAMKNYSLMYGTVRWMTSWVTACACSRLKVKMIWR